MFMKVTAESPFFSLFASTTIDMIYLECSWITETTTYAFSSKCIYNSFAYSLEIFLLIFFIPISFHE